MSPAVVGARRTTARLTAAGFTLIELLVVTAIMSLLASLILPALSRARIKRLDTRGSDQQRQMGTGFTM